MNNISFLLFLVLIYTSDQSPVKKHWHSYRKQNVELPKEVNYRLPRNVVPIHYTLNLTLEEDAFATYKFFGVSTIRIQVTEPVNSLHLHAKDMEITNIELSTEGDSIDVTWIEADSRTDIVTIKTQKELIPQNKYLLSISYNGIISPTALNGFYLSSYKYNGTTHYLASTDFEPTNARKAFPCFDEPEFKAIFDISITISKNLNAVANTKMISTDEVPGTNLKTVTFATTPLMSTYLIAFAVSEFDCTEGSTDTEVCSRQGTTNMRETALLTAPEILRIMKNYTNYNYYDSKIGKLTQIAIPDYASGAMENWGLVTYRESALLYDEEDPTNGNQQWVVTIIAHELSHQWFGDLVTLNWWSDVFLNEGFATYFEYYASDLVYPDWELPKQFVLEQLQAALDTDSNDWALPLSYYLEAPIDIDSRFDDISYSKGGSIIRMVQYFLGLDNFKLGLIDYIAKNKFATTTPDILWATFELYAQKLPLPQTPPVKMTEIMRNWTYEAGYPLLSVKSSGEDVVISQKRFLISGNSDTKWYVPITYTTQNESSSDTQTKAWLAPDDDLTLVGVLADSEWILLNNQIGYYRVDYDDNLWEKIFQALNKTDFGGIDVLNRAQIVDDLFSFARADIKNYTTIFELLLFMEKETEYYPWYSALVGFADVLERIGDENILKSFTAYLSRLTNRFYLSTPFTVEKPEDQIYTLKQTLALKWACFLNNEDCVLNAKQQLTAYRQSLIKPSNNLRSIVYCYGLRYSDNPKQDFEYLWQKYVENDSSKTEQTTILNALGCTTDTNLLNLYLDKILSEESGFRPEDFYTAWISVYSGGTTGADVTFDHLTTNYQKVVDYFGTTDDVDVLIYTVANTFKTEKQLNKLRNYTENNELSDGLYWYVTQTIENVESNLELRRKLEEELGKYFN